MLRQEIKTNDYEYVKIFCTNARRKMTVSWTTSSSATISGCHHYKQKKYKKKNI